MPEKDISKVISEKGQELKKLLTDYDASMDHWKFSLEETGEGLKVELVVRATFKNKEKAI